MASNRMTQAERVRLNMVAIHGDVADIMAALDEICGEHLSAAIAAGKFPAPRKKPHHRDKGDKK